MPHQSICSIASVPAQPLRFRSRGTGAIDAPREGTRDEYRGRADLAAVVADTYSVAGGGGVPLPRVVRVLVGGDGRGAQSTGHSACAKSEESKFGANFD